MRDECFSELNDYTEMPRSISRYTIKGDVEDALLIHIGITYLYITFKNL